MTYSDVSRHVKRWNYWRKRNKSNKIYKLLVLFGVVKSRSLELMIPITVKHSVKLKR